MVVSPVTHKLLGALFEYDDLGAHELKGIEQPAQVWRVLGERWWEPEIYRLRGELLLLNTANNWDDAEAYFHRALEISRSQKAKSLELHAMMSLARLWQSQKKIDDARLVLQDCYSWITEGFDTADLRQATNLLNELA